MIGRYSIRIENKFIQYNLEIVRNITVIRGDSATGKTTLIEMLSQYDSDGEKSGVKLACKKNCTVLSGRRWKENLNAISDSIVFIDENDRFITSAEFAAMVKESDNYYVIITRDNLDNLPYSVDEIYGLRCSGRYSSMKKVYNEFYKIYSVDDDMVNTIEIDRIVTEDSNSGYEFFEHIAKDINIDCLCAGGKSKIVRKLCEYDLRKTLVIADGAAFGCEMNRIMELKKNVDSFILYLPESFEYIVLKSGLIDGNRIKTMLEHPEDYIDSEKFFSWERYFNRVLTDETQDTFLQYKKSRLNDNYLQDKVYWAIIDAMDEIGEILKNAIIHSGCIERNITEED